jgi:hypothetical protein
MEAQPRLQEIKRPTEIPSVGEVESNQYSTGSKKKR